jgi:dienelactone hydrolase
LFRLVAVFLLVLFHTPVYAQQAFPFHNKPGGYAVGFRTVQQSDPSRSYGGKPRPIQTAIWYPAQKGGRPMRYDDYLQLLGWDDDFARAPAEREKVLAEWLKLVTEVKPAAEVATERKSVLWAVRDAQALPGKFPVLIYSPSISSNVFENAEMMEYLASHGYLVIANPALGIEGRWQKDDLAHAEAQAADIRFLVGYAQTLPQADASRLAVAGFSWGGMANVLAAAQDDRIKALVCLDGTVRYRHEMLSKVAYLKPEQLRTPLLYLAQRPQPFERALKGDKAGLDYLMKKPEQVGVAPHTVHSQHFPASL